MCACVCVYPSGNSCPDGISSFREACNQLILRCSSLKPAAGKEREREREKNGSKEEGGHSALRELLWLYNLAHYSASAHKYTHQTSRYTCQVLTLAYKYLSAFCPTLYVSPTVPSPPLSVSMLYFPPLCLFHLVSGSYHQHRLLFSLGLRLQSDSLCSLPLFPRSELASD